MTVPTLPTELIRQVLEADPPNDKSSATGWQEYYDLLLSASLVSRAWSEEARELLWRRIAVYDARRASDLMESPSFGRYLTRELHVVVSVLTFQANEARVLLNRAQKIIGGVKGLRYLKLGCAEEMEDEVTWDFGVLSLPSIQEIKSLSLVNIRFEGAGTTLPPLSISPRRLQLRNFGVYGTTPPYSMFAALPLTHLSLDSSPLISTDDDDYFELFRTVASKLEVLDLRLHVRDNGSGLNDRFISVFPSCHNLKALAVSCLGWQLGTIACLLPRPLSRLIIRDKLSSSIISITQIASVLHFPSLKKLTELTIEYNSFQRERVDERAIQNFIQHLKRRGVVMKVRTV